MGVQLKNNAITTIPLAVSSTDTAITVDDGSVFPTLGGSDYFYATIASVTGNYEVVKCTARTDDALTIVRAQEGTLAIPFEANSRIELRVTAASITDHASSAVAPLLLSTSVLAFLNALNAPLKMYIPTAYTSAAVDTAIAAAVAAGGYVQMLPGAYDYPTQNLVQSSNLTIQGVPGRLTRLVGSGSTSLTGLICVAGSLGTATTPNGSAAEDQRALTLTDGSGFAVGDYVWLESTVSSPTAGTERMLDRVTAKPSTHVLTLAHSLPYTVPTGADTIVREMTPVTGVVIRDLVFEKGTNTGVATHGFFAVNVANCTFENLRATDFTTGGGIYIYRAYNCTRRGASAYKCGDSSFADITQAESAQCTLIDTFSESSNSEGPHVDSSHYCVNIAAHSANAAGRGMETNTSSHNTHIAPMVTGAGSTGFSFANHARKNHVVDPVVSGCAHEGLWFSDQYNMNNSVDGGDVTGNALTTQTDIGCYTTDTGNRITNTKYNTITNTGFAILSYGSGLAGSGMLFGCTLSNNAGDATNDIDVAAGNFTDSTNVQSAKLGALTKRLDANWSAGTGNGMRNSAAAITDTTYHIYAVCKANGADADIYAHTSATAATVLAALILESGGSAYKFVRRIGSIIRSSAAILPFTQFGDEFLLKTVVQDVSTNNPGTSAVSATLTTPLGIQTIAKVYARFNDATPDVLAAMYVSCLEQTDVAAASTNKQLGTTVLDPITSNQVGFVPTRTSTASAIRYRISASDTDKTVILHTHGWTDPRGRT